MAAAHHGSELSGAELDAESDGVYVTNVLPPLFKVFLLCVTHMCVLRDESPGQGLPADLLGAEALWGQSLSPVWGLGTVPHHPIWGLEP